MSEMSMNKVIHGAFRRDLERFIDALGRFPAGNRARARQLGAAWDNFHDQLTVHHEGEHEIAWPALQSVGVSPDLLADHGRRARDDGRGPGRDPRRHEDPRQYGER